MYRQTIPPYILQLLYDPNLQAIIFLSGGIHLEVIESLTKQKIPERHFKTLEKIIIEHQHSLWIARNLQQSHERPRRKIQATKPPSTEEKTNTIHKQQEKASDKFHKKRRATLRKQTTLQNLFKTTPKEKGDTQSGTTLPLSKEQQKNKSNKPDTTQHKSKLAPKQPKNKTKPRKQTHLNATQQAIITTKKN